MLGEVKVAPFTGAWVEMRIRPRAASGRAVAPFTGARVEAKTICESRGEYGLHLLPRALRSNQRDSVDLTGGQAIKAAAKATRRSGDCRSRDILIQLVSGVTGTRRHQLLARARYGRCSIKRVMTDFGYVFRRRTASAELDDLSLEQLIGTSRLEMPTTTWGRMSSGVDGRT